MTNEQIGIAIAVASLSALSLMVWRFARMPKRTCIYPHCSATHSHCMHTCPHWRGEHSDFDGD